MTEEVPNTVDWTSSIEHQSQPTRIATWTKYFYVAVFRILSTRWLRQMSNHSGSVLFFTSKICIKSSPTTTLSEAKTMEFLRRNTSIPVPKVYCAFRHKDRTYIVMETISGHRLSNNWVFRSPASKAKILHQLKAIVEELRSIQPPADIGVASIDKGPIYDPQLPKNAFWGPFKSVREFHRQLRNGIELAPSDDQIPGLQQLVYFHNQAWGRPVFTHGDLSSMNILVEGDRVVGIVDWETAGWFPCYWEYVSAWNVNPQNGFWQEEVENFVGADPRALQMDAIRRQYFGSI